VVMETGNSGHLDGFCSRLCSSSPSSRDVEMQSSTTLPLVWWADNLRPPSPISPGSYCAQPASLLAIIPILPGSSSLKIGFKYEQITIKTQSLAFYTTQSIACGENVGAPVHDMISLTCCASCARNESPHRLKHM
jgi:hypothetical protein